MADDDDRRPRIREREGLLSPSFLSISIYHDRRSESNPARVHNNNNNNNNNDDGSSGGGDNDSSRSTFSTSRPILPFTVTPALDPLCFISFLTKTGQELSFSPSNFFPSISLLRPCTPRPFFVFFFFDYHPLRTLSTSRQSPPAPGTRASNTGERETRRRHTHTHSTCPSLDV